MHMFTVRQGPAVLPGIVVIPFPPSPAVYLVVRVFVTSIVAVDTSILSVNGRLGVSEGRVAVSSS